MISIRMHLPLAHQKCSEQENRDFQRQFIELVKVRANRRQLGDRFVRVVAVVKSASDDEPAGIDFEFTGRNHLGTEQVLMPFLQDLAAELRAALGYPPLRIVRIDRE